MAKYTRKPVEGMDGKIIMNVFVPGYLPEEFTVKLPNITGETVYNMRSPEAVVEALIEGLRAKYGNKVQ